MKHRITYLAVLVSLILAGTSFAQTTSVQPTGPKKVGDPSSPKPTPIPGKSFSGPLPGVPNNGIQVVWKGGSNIETCLQTGSCLKRPLPKAAGKPIAVIRGPFLDETIAPVSALVVSNKRYSLCYLTTTKENAVNECRPIRAPIIKGARIQTVNYPGIGTVLNFTLDPDLAKGITRKELDRAAVAFAKGLREAQVSATKRAAKRYAGKLIPMSTMVDAGGGGYCDDDWCIASPSDGGGSSEGGSGGYWPDEPMGNGGGWDSEIPAPTGADDGGGYPNEVPLGDDGGSGADDQVLPFIVPAIPPGATPNDAGGTTNCFNGASGPQCIITAPDPNRVDPDSGAQLPPSTGDAGWSWCDLPVISWFCGGNTAGLPQEVPEDNGGLYLPPFQWPARPEDGRPYQRYREGYEEELDKCDADRKFDEEKCSIKYTILGGPIYSRKLEETGTLTPAERKMLKDANKEYTSCMRVAGDFWGQCYKNAQDKYRE